MPPLKGKSSIIAHILKIFDSTPYASQSSISDSSSSISGSVGLRYLSSTGNSYGGARRSPMRGGRNVGDDDYDDDIFSSKDGGNFSAHQNPPEPIPGRPLRGERRIPQSPPRQRVSDGNEYRNRGGNHRVGDDYRRRGVSDRPPSLPLQRSDKPRDSEAGKSGLVSRNADSFSADDRSDEMGNGGEEEGFGGADMEEGSQPSIREFLRRSLKDDDKEAEQENRDFLAKFRLGGVGKKKDEVEKEEENKVPEEEKVEEQPQQDADAIFKKMKETGLIPNAVAMLDGLCKDGLVQEAMKLFGLMREKGTMPEVVIYTAVVEGFCQAQKFDDAKRIFKKMQANGIVPNAFSYGVLVRGLCKGKRLDEAVDYCLEMLEAGHSPNAITFTGLVDEFCKEKGLEEARKAIEALKQKGFYLEEKAVRDHLDKKGPSSPMVWEAIFGPKKRTGPF